MIDAGSRSIVPIIVGIVALFLLMFGFSVLQESNGLSDLVSMSQAGLLIDHISKLFMNVYNNLSKYLIIIFAGISGLMGLLHIIEVSRKKAFLNLNYNDTLVDTTPDYITRFGIPDLIKKSKKGTELLDKYSKNKGAIYVYDAYNIMLHVYIEMYSQFMEVDKRSIDEKMTVPVIQDIVGRISEINAYLDMNVKNIEELTKMCVIALIETGGDVKDISVANVYSYNTSDIDITTGYTVGYSNDELSELILSVPLLKKSLYDNTQF